MPLKLLEHCHRVTEKTRLSREEYMRRLKESASNTDDDFEKTGHKRQTGEITTPEPPKTVPSQIIVPTVPDQSGQTTTVPDVSGQTTTGPQQQGDSSSDDSSNSDDGGLFGGGFGLDDSTDDDEVEVTEEFEHLFKSGKIKQELHKQLEEELKKEKDSKGGLFSRLNVFLNGKMDADTFYGTVKNMTEKVYLQDFNDRYSAGLTLPDKFTDKPVKKVELRDTLPSKKTIDHAVDSLFISEGEAEFLIAKIGFHTAARIISYYRKNNAIASIRGLIDQLRTSLHKTESSKEKETLYSPLTDKSLIMDTNIAKALLMEQSDMNPEERQVKGTVEALLKSGTVDEIRLPNMVIGELVQFGSNVLALGEKKTPSIPWKPMPIEGTRDGASRVGQYADDLVKLERQQVGGSKGAPDRQLVVESLHALTKTTGVQKRLITADKGIIKHLYELYLEQVKEQNSKGTVTPVQPVDPGLPFVLQMGGNALTVVPVDATVPESGKQTDFYTPDGVKATPLKEGDPLYKQITAPKDKLAAGLFGKLIGKEDSKVTMKDLIELIDANGYDVAFVGGSVRDSVRGELPNDIDVTTNMDIDSLAAMLKNDGRFSSIPQNIVKVDKMHLLQLAIQSKFSVDIKCAMRPKGEKVKSFDEEGFYEKDAKKRDFTMNALYVDKTGKLHDPTGRGVSDSLTKNLFSLVDGFIAELDDMVSYGHLGRVMKFSARDYTVSEEQIAFVRKRMVELIRGARTDDEMGATKLSNILESARERTPAELIEVLRKLGFSDKLIRQLFPDSPSGFYEDGTPNFKHSVLPGRLDNPQTNKLPNDGLPDVKFDAETGRLYQYRMYVQDQDSEDLIVDMDMTDHSMEGHTSPHYHLYRWIGDEKSGEWDKHQQGMSATGEPGRPSVEGGKYTGPRPWHWTESLEDSQSAKQWIEIIKKQMSTDNINMEIAEKGDGLLSFADEITVHINKIRELQRKKKLSEFLMFVSKTAEKGKLPYEQDMSSLSLISSGGERLRFNKHKFAISVMLGNWDVNERPAKEEEWIRLYDLLHYTKPGANAALAKKAAKWAETGMSASWFVFVERFEFYMAAASKSQTELTETDVNDQYSKLKVAFKSGEQLSAQSDDKQSLKVHLVEVVETAKAGKLGFVSEPAAKYHFLKHAEELSTETVKTDYTFDKYVADALLTIADGKSVGYYEQLGSQGFVFIKDEKKAIVRVEKDHTAHLASFYSIRKKEGSEDSVHEFGESFKVSKTGGSGGSSGGGKSGTGDMNRLFGSLEFFVQSAITQYDKGAQDKAQQQASAAKQVLDDIIIPMFYTKLNTFNPEYVEETIKRITSFREQVDFVSNLGGQLKEQQTIMALVETMDRDVRLLGQEIKQVEEALKKSAPPSGGTVSSGTDSSTEQTVSTVQTKDWAEQLEEKLKKMNGELKKKEEELEQLRKLAKTTSPLGSGSDVSDSPKGLSNIGNSCYIGSIMQFMALDETYAGLFLNALPVETTPLPVRQLQLLGRPIIQKLQAKQSVTVEELTSFRQSLLHNGWLQGNELRIASQQDASELFVFLTDKLKLDEQLGVTTDYSMQGGDAQVDSLESMLVLSEIEEGIDLNTLLERNMFGRVENFRNELNVPYLRKFSSLPEVLTIQIARFQYSRELQRVVKVDMNVPVPQQKLIIDDDFIEDDNEDDDVEYHLESFILHIGDSPTQGHYVGYFKRDDQWYGYNDSVVRPVTEEEVNTLSRKAYLLRFRKS